MEVYHAQRRYHAHFSSYTADACVLGFCPVIHGIALHISADSDRFLAVATDTTGAVLLQVNDRGRLWKPE